MKIIVNGLFFIGIVLSISMGILRAESITLTTYYPSPYGSYDELRANRMSIGSGYAGLPLANGNLIAEGPVGIGMGTPAAQLDIVAPPQLQDGLRIVGNVNGSAGGMSIFDGLLRNDNPDGYVGWRAIAQSAELSLLACGSNYIHNPVEDALSANDVALFANNSGNMNFIKWTSGSMNFYIDTDVLGRAIHRMIINNNGRVGIGTANPTVPLDVNGTIRGNMIDLTANPGGSTPNMTTYGMTDINVANGADLRILSADGSNLVLARGGLGGGGLRAESDIMANNGFTIGTNNSGIKIRYGITAVQSVPNHSNRDFTLSYSGFTAAPQIIAIPYSDSPNNPSADCWVVSGSVTSTQAVVRVWQEINDTNVSISWLAIGN